mmetsp:Transcript_5376/g.10264  ORF Transcript_5376/g.10264 Transcript_5376/m.10264 type:complete len:214 (-) Transcript_5376:155-796(-)
MMLPLSSGSSPCCIITFPLQVDTARSLVSMKGVPRCGMQPELGASNACLLFSSWASCMSALSSSIINISASSSSGNWPLSNSSCCKAIFLVLVEFSFEGRFVFSDTECVTAASASSVPSLFGARLRSASSVRLLRFCLRRKIRTLTPPNASISTPSKRILSNLALIGGSGVPSHGTQWSSCTHEEKYSTKRRCEAESKPCTVSVAPGAVRVRS